MAPPLPIFMPNEFVPVRFVNPPPATFELGEAKVNEEKVNAYDPPFLLGALGQGRISRQRGKILSREFLSKLNGWPTVVIGGHLILQAASWGFFGLLQSRRGLPLSHSRAVWASANPHIVDWITTLFATILAFLTTSLFSFAIRKSTTLHLHGDGMSLAAFIASIKLSARSIILDPDHRRRKLGLMSIFIFFMSGGVLTAGFKALITPYSIDVNGPIVGYEIDLSSPVLGQFENNEALKSCLETGTNTPLFIVGQTESGFAAAKGHIGVPATFAMMDQTVNISTAGILPLALKSRNTTTWFTGASFNDSQSLPSTIRSVTNLPKGLSSAYSLIQQGFTTDVTCKLWDPANSTVPKLSVFNSTVTDWTPVRNGLPNITFNGLDSECQVDSRLSGSNSSEAYTLPHQPNYLLMIACPSQDSYSTRPDPDENTSDAAELELIFNVFPGGIYGFLSTTECTLVPRITVVEAEYSNVLNTLTIPGGQLADINGPATLAAVKTLYDMVFFSQSSASNGVADHLKSLISEQDGVAYNQAGKVVYTPATTMRILEDYIRGVTEYSASVFRACLSANQDFLDALPSNMNVSTGGTFHSNTVGWIHASPVTLLELIPGTLIAIFTIYAVVMTLAYTAVNPNDEPFDPSDPMHLLAASAAGHLTDVFTGTRKENLQAVDEANVFLRDIRGRGPALIRSDKEMSFT
ncbi:hypothetical protein B0H19DRAFT_1252474 [Mycena capillaripes]|nr:hypothetical protein B0H19DRAFT_1252474 [Mycena capillaripes]